MSKRKPTGFVAVCQCGKTVGALDYNRTERAEAGKIMGRWLHDGCTIQPKFDGAWQVHVEPCSCDESQTEQPASEERVCRWTRITHSGMYHGEYKTDCGQIFEGNELGQVGSGYLHCPKCTGRIVEAE